jgi:Ankyrin repeats (3 copies)
MSCALALCATSLLFLAHRGIYSLLQYRALLRFGRALRNQPPFRYAFRGNSDDGGVNIDNEMVFAKKAEEKTPIDVNAQGGIFNRNTALQAASHGSHEKIVQMLIDNGAHVDEQGGLHGYGAALYAASYSGHKRIVQILIDNGAEVNVRGGKYGSALNAAYHKGYKKIVQMLVDNGADDP